MGVYFHDRASGVIHELSNPIPDSILRYYDPSKPTWKMSPSERVNAKRDSDSLDAQLQQAAVTRISHTVRRNDDLMAQGRSNFAKDNGTAARLINQAPDGEIIGSSKAKGYVGPLYATSTSYGFSRKALKNKADQLERNAQKKGK